MAAVFKLVQVALKLFTKRRDKEATEMANLLDAQAKLRDDLGEALDRANDTSADLRKRMTELEERLSKKYKECEEILRERDRLTTENQDLKAEIRFLKRAYKSGD